jgi:hypothetical protein
MADPSVPPLTSTGLAQPRLNLGATRFTFQSEPAAGGIHGVDIEE